MPEDGKIYVDPQTGATIFDDGERVMPSEDDTPIETDSEGRGSAFGIPDEPAAATPQGAVPAAPVAAPPAAAPVLAQPVPGSPPPPPPSGDLVAELQARGVTSAAIHQRIAAAVEAGGPNQADALGWLENAVATVKARALAAELERREQREAGLALAREHPELFGLRPKSAAPAQAPPTPAPATPAGTPPEMLDLDTARILGLA